MKNRLARTLLETYVGSRAGELILAGATRRGSGTTVGAAIMICDLRDFTRISDNWPRDDVIDLLNGYFDAMSEPIARHGGGNTEIHRRRSARHFSSQPTIGLRKSAASGVRSPSGHDCPER